MENNSLLNVEGLKLYFRTSRGPVQAVDNVDFKLPKHEAVVFIGESGCGKTSFAKAILRLLPRNVLESSGDAEGHEKVAMSMCGFRVRKVLPWVRMSMVP